MKNKWVFIGFLYLFLQPVSSQPTVCYHQDVYDNIKEFEEDLLTIGYPVAMLMIAYMGLKYTSSTSAQERENNKRAIIYVIIGMLILYAGSEFMIWVLCGGT